MVTEEEVKAADVLGDPDGDSDEEVMQEADDEDTVANSEPTFRTWHTSLLAQTNAMRILLKLADFLDTTKSEDDDDEEFEDCEDMDAEDETETHAQVIDMDQ